MTCAIPATAGMIKYSRVDKSFHPFLLLMPAAVITELIADIPYMLYESYTLMDIAHPLYHIVEIYLFLIFFKRNHVYTTPWLQWLIPLIGVIIFASSYIIYQNFENEVCNICLIAYTAIIIIFSIRLISREVFETKINAFKNPRMIIAFGCVFFYSFYLLVKVFVHLNTQLNLFGSIFSIHQIVNALTYFIFTWAIIWIPIKPKY